MIKNDQMIIFQMVFFPDQFLFTHMLTHMLTHMGSICWSSNPKICRGTVLSGPSALDLRRMESWNESVGLDVLDDVEMISGIYSYRCIHVYIYISMWKYSIEGESNSSVCEAFNCQGTDLPVPSWENPRQRLQFEALELWFNWWIIQKKQKDHEGSLEEKIWIWEKIMKD